MNPPDAASRHIRLTSRPGQGPAGVPSIHWGPAGCFTDQLALNAEGLARVQGRGLD